MSRSLIVCLGISVCVAAPAAAHHSYAEFDRCTSVTVEGEIERIAWANPHVIMVIRTADSQYHVQWSDLRRLQRDGVPAGTLAIGDRVVVTGSTNRNPELKIMTLLTEVRRASDGWQWTRPRQQVCGE
jgi:hypothetical protein